MGAGGVGAKRERMTEQTFGFRRFVGKLAGSAEVQGGAGMSRIDAERGAEAGLGFREVPWV